MKRKDNGFTLIELLAVIVILGLLMAIAIPSVTKYITQSRKKTVSTTIGNYMGALTNQVNDMEYTFTASNTIYAVPIECISLERGGTNPFGKWHQASNAYWAYVLVQYDDATSSYTYGFTFKDSAGYGLYPTTSEKLSENGSQINTDLDLTRPTNGTIANITAKDNWTGFDIEADTKLVVLQATSEGGSGNGTTTCTLCQKGDNYSEVEAEKANGNAGGGSNNVSYKLSGKWTFNETLTHTGWASGTSKKHENINFNGIKPDGTYTDKRTSFDYWPAGTLAERAISNAEDCEVILISNSTLYGLYHYNHNEASCGASSFIKQGEVGQAYRSIDFGSTEQEVSKEFYEWFVANATKQ